MTEPTACCPARCPGAKPYCDNCDLLVGLEGLHVLKVEPGPDRLSVTVESAPAPLGCPRCGVVAISHVPQPVLVRAPPLRHALVCLGIHGQMVYVGRATRTVGVKLSSWPTAQNTAYLIDTLRAFGAIGRHSLALPKPAGLATS